MNGHWLSYTSAIFPARLQVARSNKRSVSGCSAPTVGAHTQIGVPEPFLRVITAKSQVYFLKNPTSMKRIFINARVTCKLLALVDAVDPDFCAGVFPATADQ